MSPLDIEQTILVKKRREELEHINKNKWYMSERLGKDVGWEKALFDWLLNKKSTCVFLKIR
jgi:hypothetical protein